MSVVLVTGSSSGIGLNTVRQFAKAGHQVIATMRDVTSSGARLLEELARNENLKIDIQKLDVTSDDDVAAVFAHIEAVYQGSLDVLINNAGFGYLGAVETFSIEEIKCQYETNIFGVIRMCKAAIPVMRKAGGGKIINLSSINGRISFPLYGVYSSSKFAVETLSESMRMEVWQWGIDVATVEPGAFLTNFVNNRQIASEFGQSTEYAAVREGFLKRYLGAQQTAQNGSLLSKLLDPKRVANRIYKLSQMRRMPVRNVVGVDARLFKLIKAVVPQVLWEWGIRKIYGIE